MTWETGKRDPFLSDSHWYAALAALPDFPSSSEGCVVLGNSSPTCYGGAPSLQPLQNTWSKDIM